MYHIKNAFPELCKVYGIISAMPISYCTEECVKTRLRSDLDLDMFKSVIHSFYTTHFAFFHETQLRHQSCPLLSKGHCQYFAGSGSVDQLWRISHLPTEQLPEIVWSE